MDNQGGFRLFVCFVFGCLFVCLPLYLFDHSDGCGVAEDNADAKGTFVDIKGMLAMVVMMMITMGVVLMKNELLRVSQELIEENLQIPVDVGTILSGGERHCLHGRRS